jgi:hypothetical protein
VNIKSKLSRRAALVGAIALAPAAAVAAVPIGADLDTELIAAGEQLIALYKRDLELRALLWGPSPMQREIREGPVRGDR